MARSVPIVIASHASLVGYLSICSLKCVEPIWLTNLAYDGYISRDTCYIASELVSMGSIGSVLRSSSFSASPIS